MLQFARENSVMTRYNAMQNGTEEVSETMETLIALQAGTIDLSGAPEEIKILPLGEVKSTKGNLPGEMMPA